METRPDLQQGANTASGTDGSDSRTGNFGQEFQERTFTGTILSDNPDDVPLLDFEINIA